MSIQIMIVDDDRAVRFFHKITVTESTPSADPVSFADGKQALDFLDQQNIKDDYYLVLLDINMPVMNGWELLRAISEKPYCSHVFVAMVTSSVDKADKEEAKKYSQVIDFVEKPITTEQCKRLMEMPTIANLT